MSEVRPRKPAHFTRFCLADLWRLTSDFCRHGRKAHADDATVFRGQTKDLFAGVFRVVRRRSLEGKRGFSVCRCLPKSVDLYPGGYNETGIKTPLGNHADLARFAQDAGNLIQLVHEELRRWWPKQLIDHKRINETRSRT